MANNDIYEKMAEIFKYPGSQNFINYLKVLFTPEEGELLLEFLKPATCEQVAKRLNIDKKTLSEKLADFKRRRLLFHKYDEYLFHLALHGGFARISKAKEEDLPQGFWDAYNDFMPEIEERMITRSVEVAKQVPVSGIMARIIPARLAIDSNPNIKPEDILPEEDVHAMLRMKGSQETMAVCDCACRIRAHMCDRPKSTCLEFGKYAEFDLNQSSKLKVVSIDEAIAISDQAERAGLLKSNGIRKENGGVLCHCCDDCCDVMGAVIRSGNAHLLRNPSRYRARVDSESCIGCQTCVDRCFFGAIEMTKVPGSKKLKASVDEEKCLGCGLCVVGCEQKALIFDLVKPPEYLSVDQEGKMLPLGDDDGTVWRPFTTAP
jgi:ferredoxin